MEFKDKLKKLRTDKNISQYKLALELNISRSVIGKWETGLAYPNEDNMRLLIEYFDVDENYFESNYKVPKVLVDKNKQIYKQRRLIIGLSCVLLFFLIVGVILTCMYYPRSYSSYIREELEDVKSVELTYYDQKYILDKTQSILFVNELLDIEVVPTYQKRKVETIYYIYIIFEDNVYNINGYHLRSNTNKVDFNVNSSELFDLVQKYINSK